MSKIIEKIKSLKASTKIRTILQILAYVNQLIALLGNTTFANNVAYQWISFAFTVVITALSYWYNNDWSKAAQVCGDIFDMLKDGKITADELSAFIAKYKSSNTSSTDVTVDSKSEDNAKKD